MDIPRPEHPRPDFFRADWLNLNGVWQFELDPGRSGHERRWFESGSFGKEIRVPFCMESPLGGVGVKDFVAGVWYRRTFAVPANWSGRRVLLNVGACDFQSRVYVNSRLVGEHVGGYCGFRFDITDAVRDGENVLVIEAQDDLRSGLQPGGKQSRLFNSHGCSYTRVTGIWQTVYLEAVPATYIAHVKVHPDFDGQCVGVEVFPGGEVQKARVEVTVLADGKKATSGEAELLGSPGRVRLELPEMVAWSPEQPFLYDLELTLSTPAGRDAVTSYFGMRNVHTAGRVLYLNNDPFFMRTVLDQGYYPEGIYTTPSDEALRKDIAISQAAGFNGARLHQKVFEPRFLYWADKLGYVVWGEMGSWNLNMESPLGVGNFIDEWMEILRRDFNHPSIIGWCPLNETRGQTGSLPRWLHKHLYDLNKAVDPARLAIDTSGYIHYAGVGTDLYDVHSYQAPDELRRVYEPLAAGRWAEAFRNFPDKDLAYDGSRPYFASEIGGIWWNPRSSGGDWGYGERPKTEEEFVRRYVETIEVLNGTPNLCGWCYTQLYDIEQETNGLYYYDREPKFAPEVLTKLRRANEGETAYPK